MKPFKIPQKVIVPLLVLSLSIGAGAPARAGIEDDIASFLGIDRFVSEFEGFFSSLEEHFNGLIDEVLAVVSDEGIGELGQLEGDLNATVGELGLPDPEELSELVLEELGLQVGTQGAKEINDRVFREIARSSANTVLSKEGQQRTRAEMEATQSAVEQASRIAEKVKSATSSQEVLKNLGDQNAQIAQVLGQVALGEQQRRIDGAMTNSQLANIDEKLEGERVIQDLERANATRSAIELMSAGSYFIE